MALFKGELSYEDIVNRMTFRDLVGLRDARVKQILDENKDREANDLERAKEEIRKQILAPLPPGTNLSDMK